MNPYVECRRAPRRKDEAAHDAATFKSSCLETEREVDGRWIAEVPELAGVMAYGGTRDEAIAHVEVLALRVLAENIEEDG